MTRRPVTKGRKPLTDEERQALIRMHSVGRVFVPATHPAFEAYTLLAARRLAAWTKGRRRASGLVFWLTDEGRPVAGRIARGYE